jgi:hypothetical protein
LTKSATELVVDIILAKQAAMASLSKLAEALLEAGADPEVVERFVAAKLAELEGGEDQ